MVHLDTQMFEQQSAFLGPWLATHQGQKVSFFAKKKKKSEGFMSLSYSAIWLA